MAQWQKVLKLDPARQVAVSRLYGEVLPREYRHCLGDWIEDQNWDLAADDEDKATECFHKLLCHLELQEKLSYQMNNILQGPNFPRIKCHFEKHFKDYPVKLAKLICDCLSKERKILDSTIETQDSEPRNQEQSDMGNKISGLRNEILTAEQQIKYLENLHVELLNELPLSPALARDGLLLKAKSDTQNKTKEMLIKQLESILGLAGSIVSSLIFEKLPKWKSQQQNVCIGGPTGSCINELQSWFTTVAEDLQQLRGQLKKFHEQEMKYSSGEPFNLLTQVTQYEEHTHDLLRRLHENALVVEKQPCMKSLPQQPLIVKTKVAFSVKVRYLIKLKEFYSLLLVTPFFDKDVNDITINGNNDCSKFRKFNLTANKSPRISKVLALDFTSDALVAEFENLTLTEERDAGTRSNNQSSLPVMEELHIIKFVTQLQWLGQALDVETSTLPLVVVSSSNQTPSAWASLLWCNMQTGEPKNRSLFLSPPSVTWQRLSEVLNWQFLSISKRGLNEDQLSMLRDKFVDQADGLVHWTRFSKEGVWFWIYGILYLIEKHLLDIWNDGFIMGFVSKERVDSLLRNMQTGTFILRFSETVKEGAITFSWVEHLNGGTHVHAVEPCTEKDLEMMSLPNLIRCYNYVSPENTLRNPLHYLYPSIPKEEAFKRHYSNKTRRSILNEYLSRRWAALSSLPTPLLSPDEEMDSPEEEFIEDMDIVLEHFSPDLEKLIMEELQKELDNEKAETSTRQHP
ncbi:signal transducer and activator of transcription 1-alpha/beta-like isoform X2 [Lampris incognitus]|uniref:signal transducer and activator of transcription 1-alpha/beta-like isoform X2 n=1 Tax=Lampris incognitus TaxID=2546036 RepID=UPI0024B54815|nr:signal transducer and activator of transcription 1-alpha/beta-like isoform X2 [Lampris incognitus]